MATEIKIPQIAEGVESATVTEILVKEGDTIEKEQSVIAVESDKASVEIPSPEAGTITSIEVSEGDEVSVGDVILKLKGGDSEESDSEEDNSEENDSEKEEKGKKDQSGEDHKKAPEEDNSEEESSEEKKKKQVKEQESSDDENEEEGEEKEEEEKENKEDKVSKNENNGEKETSASGGIPAAPGVRRLARELGIDIREVKGSGADGRISKEDLKDFNKTGKEKKASSTGLSLPDFSKWGETERKPLSGIRKATAKSTSAAWSNIPHVFQFDEADISDIEEYMEKLKKKSEAGITITAILVKIAATALRQFPKFNASIDMENEEMILKKYVNIGVAVDTEKGLLVPVIRDADQKTIIEIATEITALAEKAREGKLTAEEMQGGNFTISNLGGIGGTNFTPIVYHPQVAILGVSRAKKQPVYIDDNFEPRDILPLSLSYDHRLIDGAEGVRFLHWISRALENPFEALLGA
ncbi:2-oxo acid dehydrogenase subunit E2 [Zunongwangia sp. F363]|uniref:Dihydrolipoamide acetyltransferase component of pyruvate dehydrogenase complex n=1 Tax=Autumnicola tepida TaxID=3075595 RepID=A0ABU3C8K5_9FLAO|nr:2-oxo acid dehydrogenase subunit E2 [Zunongwangia sp. F363]MDT0642679.1 2-oxo acid dehydrogenase subunit E2 [Zunongwangia sp. F363]